MRIVFLHDNFPAQFGRFAQFLAMSGWDVWFGTKRKGVSLPGINLFHYEMHRDVTEKTHPYSVNYERALINGQAAARACLELKKKGLVPDIVVAHSGWGPGLFVKDVWPEARYVGYFEWFYRADAPDVAFLQERFDLDAQLRLRARNAAILQDLASCDLGLCPTAFQKAQFPACFDEKLSVIHDGIDTDYYSPEPEKALALPGHDFTGADELITYVARGMEPYRGFLQFIEALRIILEKRPGAHAVIVGEDRVAYGKKLPPGDSYKKRALESCHLDWRRVHFTGLLPQSQYRTVLQASTVHAYLTIPFVLSWSMMEAMSAGCAIVASDTAPVRELADQAPSALTLSSLTPEEVAACIIALLDDATARKRQGASARNLITNLYGTDAIFQAKRKLFESLISKSKPTSSCLRGRVRIIH